MSLLVVLLVLAPKAHAELPSGEKKQLEIVVMQLASLNQTIVAKSLSQLIDYPRAESLDALVALRDGTLRATLDKSAVILDPTNGPIDALNRLPLKPTESIGLKQVPINNQIRRQLKSAIPLAQLRSADVAQRILAAKSLQSGFPPQGLTAVRQSAIFEPELKVRRALLLALAPYDLREPTATNRQEILQLLADQGDASHERLLQEILTTPPRSEHTGEDVELKVAAEHALTKIIRRKAIAEYTGTLLYGISLGSVLLLTSLGLAISLGLMGIINMAHGELLMIGAYATFIVQNMFRQHLPEYLDWYIAVAIPIAFLSAGLVGILMERIVLRHLYGRPLETLLATWGISLVLIQTVRMLFGASNVEVASPSWLTGSAECYGALLPINRIFCIGFTALVCGGTWLLFQKSRFGLAVRAISQNRSMASAGGISTNKIDMLTFVFGAGVAGLAGLVLTQLGNVGPELGQGYLVDSFLVVVFGGVGKILGTVFAALGLGVVNKLLEPMLGAVLGKILVLLFLVVFIQRRPQGLYSIQTRESDL